MKENRRVISVSGEQVSGEREARALRDGATKLTSMLSGLAVTLADNARELRRQWWIRLPDSVQELRVVQADELASELEDIQRRLMVVTKRTSTLAAGEEEFMAELPEKK